MTLLSRIFLLEELPPLHGNRMKRPIKTPKLHLGDTGLACTLLGLDAEMLWKHRAVFGRLLETFVYQELRRHASWQEETIIFSHFRDKDKVEIDVVLESGGRVAGVEVKAVATVTSDDFKGLRKLQDALQGRFASGVVLYDGGSVVPFGNNLYAVPISCLWHTN